ncbi:Sec1-like protein [Suillus hirtellus]|nr:Sec1-like protein [Suillus hirtellus]
MAAASASTSDAQASYGTERDNEPRLDVELLKDTARKALIDTLNAVNGAKTLVLDPTLAGPLGLVTEVALLKHHGVDKMFWLEPGPLTPTTTNVVYLCRPLIKYVKIIADQVKAHIRESQKHRYTLFLVPRTSTLVSRILEEEGVLGDITISSYNLQFIPIADDVISLENDNAFKELWVDGDETVIYNSALALNSLQKVYGRFPRILGKGDYASRLATLLTKSLPDQPSPLSDSLIPSAPFDSLIIIDRTVDMITPLLTQLTYEGLIDEFIGLKNSSLLALPAVPNPSNPNATPSGSASVTPLINEKTKKHHLSTSTDPLLAELRDLNFSSVGKRLSKVAHRLDEDYKARLQAKTVAQLRDFVGKLGGLQGEHQALRLHTGLSEMLSLKTRTELFNKSLEVQQNLLASYEVSTQISAIEDMIAQGASMQTIVRLLCLASITNGGIKAKSLDSVKRELLQAYGYNYLPLLLSLATPPLAVLLPNPLPISATPVVAGNKYPFTTLRKSLRLLIDDNPEALEEVENDISYTYSGYAPISIRLVQCVAQKSGVISNPAEKSSADDGDAKGKGSSARKLHAHPIVGWKGFEDVLGTIPGKTFDIAQKVPVSTNSTASSVASLMRPHEQTTTSAVFFLGGCTYTEIAALRWVSRQNKGRKFLIVTTGIVSGNSLIDSIASTGKNLSATKDVNTY